MKWLCSRRKRERPEGGARAHHAAQMSLQDQISQWPEVLEVSASLRTLRERNHFAEQVQRVFGGRS